MSPRERRPRSLREVAIAATTQVGDQGLTTGRTAGLLAGLPTSVPGYAIDRLCAGAMTAVTTTASGIAFGAYDVAVAGGVEHMGRHPMGDGAAQQPAAAAQHAHGSPRDQDRCHRDQQQGGSRRAQQDRFPVVT